MKNKNIGRGGSRTDGPLSLPSYYHNNNNSYYQQQNDCGWLEEQQPRKVGGGRSRSTSGRQQRDSSKRRVSNTAIDHLIAKVGFFDILAKKNNLIVY